MLAILIIVVSLSFLSWMAILIALVDNYGKEPELGSYQGSPKVGSKVPLVSVIIPARDEEDRIGNCLQAVLEQDYPDFEVMVVDDRSSDRTAEIVETFSQNDRRVHLVKGKPLPSGWAGKCHAIHQGVEKARGEWLLMLDTDTYLKSGCLSATVSDAMDKKADLYTIIFEAKCQSFWEKVVQPLFFQFMLIVLPIYKINDPAGKEAAAPGPYLLFRRSAYEAIGGHAGMKDEVVEDLMLARKIKEQGFKLYIANAVEQVISYRRIGLKEIWHGWSRVFYSGINESPLMAGAVFLSMALFLLLPWLVVPWSAMEIIGAYHPLPWIALFVLSFAHCLLFVAIRRILFVFYKLDKTLAWLQPLAVLVGMAILVNSVLTAGGKQTVVWRGRRY